MLHLEKNIEILYVERNDLFADAEKFKSIYLVVLPGICQYL
jgi:hypothetical protein